MSSLGRTFSPPDKVKAKIYTCNYDSKKVVDLSNNLAETILENKLTPIEAAFLLARMCKMFGGGLYGEDYPLKKNDDDVYAEFTSEPSLDKAMILAGCFIEKTQSALVQTAETGMWPGTEFFLPKKALEELRILAKEIEKSE